MKDIDFDELDKAVNSLMGGVKKDVADSSKTLDISTTLKEGEQPKYENIQRVAEKIGSEALPQPGETTAVLKDTDEKAVASVTLPGAAVAAPVTAPVAAAMPSVAPEPTAPFTSTAAIEPKQRPSGRFMDVMHPSSDMKTAGSATLPSTPAITVPPRSATPLAPEPPAPSAEAVALPSTSEPPKNDVHASETPVQVSEPSVAAAPEVPEELSVTEAATNDQPPQENTIEPAPLVSPFLPDAKVEKRPLGGTMADEEHTADSMVDVFDSRYETDNSADTQIVPKVDAPHVPAELNADLLAVETTAATPDEEAFPVMHDTGGTVAHSTLTSIETSVSPDAPTNEVAQKVLAETPSPDTDGAIFDTSDYHTPVTHPAKHGHEWLWIIAVIVIVVVCAAGGAAFYLLTAQ